MNPRDYITGRQLLWAQRRGIDLQGSKGEKGRKGYTKTLAANLFEPLNEDVRGQFSAGDGGELNGSPCRMQALHSSSALAVNIFHYWRQHRAEPVLAQGLQVWASKIAELRFEVKFPVVGAAARAGFKRDPNLDCAILYERESGIRVVGIEGKFCEPFGGRDKRPMSTKYLSLDAWSEVPACRVLAERLCRDDGQFAFLDGPQLMKHLLGLKNGFGLHGFCLFYIFYDVPGQDGAKHRTEVEEFRQTAEADKIDFRFASYQEVILRLAAASRIDHQPYIDYVAERYV